GPLNVVTGGGRDGEPIASAFAPTCSRLGVGGRSFPGVRRRTRERLRRVGALSLKPRPPSQMYAEVDRRGAARSAGPGETVRVWKWALRLREGGDCNGGVSPRSSRSFPPHERRRRPANEYPR